MIADAFYFALIICSKLKKNFNFDISKLNSVLSDGKNIINRYTHIEYITPIWMVYRGKLLLVKIL